MTRVMENRTSQQGVGQLMQQLFAVKTGFLVLFVTLSTSTISWLGSAGLLFNCCCC